MREYFAYHKARKIRIQYYEEYEKVTWYFADLTKLIRFVSNIARNMKSYMILCRSYKTYETFIQYYEEYGKLYKIIYRSQSMWISYTILWGIWKTQLKSK